MMRRLGWAMCLASVACAEPTELVVFVDTTLGVPCEVDAFRITVQGDGAAVVREASAAAGQASVTVLKESGGNTFAVTVEGLKSGRTVATGAANLAFAPEASRQVHVVLGSECLTAPCNFSDALTTLAPPAASTRDTCEGRASRYSFTTQTGLVEVIDACALAAGPFQSFSGLADTEVKVDDATLADLIANGFDFRLFGEDVKQVWVADDGFISFGTEPTGATANRVSNNEGITSPGHPRYGVLAFWDDLALQPSGRICAAMATAGGRNTLWVSWKRACIHPCNAVDDLNFSIGLEEDTNRITIGFGTMTSIEADRAAGADAVVGVIRSEAPACSASECSAGLCPDGTTPCGFTQVFSRTLQTTGWPATYVLEPIPDL